MPIWTGILYADISDHLPLFQITVYVWECEKAQLLWLFTDLDDYKPLSFY